MSTMKMSKQLRIVPIALAALAACLQVANSQSSASPAKTDPIPQTIGRSARAYDVTMTPFAQKALMRSASPEQAKT
jgi:hypothetical protein